MTQMTAHSAEVLNEQNAEGVSCSASQPQSHAAANDSQRSEIIREATPPSTRRRSDFGTQHPALGAQHSIPGHKRRFSNRRHSAISYQNAAHNQFWEPTSVNPSNLAEYELERRLSLPLEVSPQDAFNFDGWEKSLFAEELEKVACGEFWQGGAGGAGNSRVSLRHMRAARDSASLSSLVFSSRPITMFFSSWIGSLLSGLLAIALGLRSASIWADTLQDFSVETTSCSIIPSPLSRSAAVEEYGPMFSGFPIFSNNHTQVDGVLHFGLEQGAKVDGIYLRMSRDDDAPLAFQIRCVVESGKDEEVARFSRFGPYRRRGEVITYCFNNAAFEVGLLYWQWQYGLCFETSVSTCVISLMAICARLRPEISKVTISIYLIGIFLFTGIRPWVVMILEKTNAHLIVAVACHEFSSLPLSYAFWAEKHLMETILLWSSTFVWYRVVEIVQSSDSSNIALSLGPLIFAGMLPVFIFVAIYAWRLHVLRRIDREMEGGRQMYARVFQRFVVAELGNLKELAVVSEAVDLKPEHARHFHRKRLRDKATTVQTEDPSVSVTAELTTSLAFQRTPSATSSATGSMDGRFATTSSVAGRSDLYIPLTRDLRNPIKSVDQLYVQARFAEVLLRRFSKECALHHSGHFRSKVNSELVRWSDIAKDEEADSMIAWPPLKRVSRTVEKSIRSYQSDVSKVTDIVRTGIYFQTLGDILSCLKIIAKNNEVEIVRIKNKFDLGYKDAMDSGFRVVHLNLCFQSVEAALLGVENHVCEMQLGLIEFAKISNDEGHRTYVHNRNMMGI